MQLKEIKMVIKEKTDIQIKDFNGVSFEGSLDGISWETILMKDDFDQS